MMERNGTDGATARFVTFGFGREKRANDVDDDGDDGDDDDARRASFHSSFHRFIDSIHSFVRSRSVCFLRSRARRVDSLATTTTGGGGGSRRRSGASVRDACTAHVARTSTRGWSGGDGFHGDGFDSTT